MSDKFIWGVHLIGVAASLRDPNFTGEVYLDEAYDTEEEARNRAFSLKGTISVKTNIGFMKINFPNIIGARVVKSKVLEVSKPTKSTSVLTLPKDKMLTIN